MPRNHQMQIYSDLNNFNFWQTYFSKPINRQVQIYSDWNNFIFLADTLFKADKLLNANWFWLKQFHISDRHTFQSR